MARGLTKAERLLQLEALLLCHPEGLRKTQIALRLGVNRSTAGRYVAELTDIVPMVEDDDGRLWIDRSRYLPPVRLSLLEIESIRIAFRLFSKKVRLPFPHASASLRKLAVAAEGTSSRMSRRLSETADSMDSHPYAPFTRRYRLVMEALIAASAEHRCVQLRHLSVRRKTVDEYLFHPYCLEPYPDGNSLHAIGFCPTVEQIRTFKVERIRSVTPTGGTFEPADGFDVEAFTSGTWGIWRAGDRAPVGVALVFSAAVAERVRETVWHETQVLEDRADGRLLFRASVAEPLEMYPWIRGWGSDVEILEPLELRKRFCEEIQVLRAAYDAG